MLEALQWIDSTLRRDAREASDRYRGVIDLINLRSQVKIPYFAVRLVWVDVDHPATEYDYYLKVESTLENTPAIRVETLLEKRPDGFAREIIVTKDQSRTIVAPNISIQETDRLALGLLSTVQSQDQIGKMIGDWWRRAVFLRLSPNRLTESAPAQRRSFDPILDEEGHTLPTLLNELSDEQRELLVDRIQAVLPGMRDVQVTTEGSERNQRANYALLERMPYRGRSGRYQFPIPAWMLSEGTRRVTALFALLIHDPVPSFLSIEEVENGLDPWTTITVLDQLEDATLRGTQVVLTTHSPWLLDHVPLSSVFLVHRDEGNTVYRKFHEVDEVAAFDTSLPPGTRYLNLTQE